MPGNLMQSRLLRQGSSYAVIGGLQLLLDWAAFVALSATGVPASGANVSGRVCGALLGFWLNGRYTFADQSGSARLGWSRFGRFLVMWLVMTVISTWLMVRVEAELGLRLAWLAKPLVEG
ncbi:MAG: GtrA family protein, partial [Pseudoxanthomonas sp.]